MCGHIYIIDFGKMQQYRKDNQGLKRIIRFVPLCVTFFAYVKILSIGRFHCKLFRQATEDELPELRVRGIAGMRCA